MTKILGVVSTVFIIGVFRQPTSRLRTAASSSRAGAAGRLANRR